MEVFVSLIILGLIAGFLSSLFGVGGGIIIIPSLFFLFPPLPAQTVIGSSLLFITLNSLINLHNFWHSGIRPSFKRLIPVLTMAIVGVVAGGGFTGYLHTSAIQLIFATIISVIALRIFIQAYKKYSPSQKKLRATHPLRGAGIGLLGGLTSGLTGLGGGSVMVPLLINWYNIPMQKVSVYSNCIMSISASMGVLTFLVMPRPIISYSFLDFFQVGQLNIGISLITVIGCFISSPWGVKISQKISQVYLQYLFASLLTIIAGKIFWTNF